MKRLLVLVVALLLAAGCSGGGQKVLLGPEVPIRLAIVSQKGTAATVEILEVSDAGRVPQLGDGGWFLSQVAFAKVFEMMAQQRRRITELEAGN